MYRVQNPVNNQIVEKFDNATDLDVDKALESAAAAYRDWGARTFAERAQIVGRVADLFHERKEELAHIAAAEMGKPLSEGIEEAEFSGDIIQYYVDNGESFAKDQSIPTGEGTAKVRRLPIGPLVGIMPWNFPFYQIARFVGPNLMLGNTIVLKHAEICPRSALAV